jgi:hypothetical protein
MKNVKVELTVEEALLLATLASDQLFRKEFIDPKMPGYKGDPAELGLGKNLVVRLRELAREASGSSASPVSKRPPSHLSRSANGLPDAL